MLLLISDALKIDVRMMTTQIYCKISQVFFTNRRIAQQRVQCLFNNFAQRNFIICDDPPISLMHRKGKIPMRSPVVSCYSCNFAHDGSPDT